MRCKFKYSVSLILIFLYPELLFPQYTINDYDLVKTTFNRSFNKEIINTYLRSRDPGKISAAYLTISHSADTGYAETILKTGYHLSPKDLIHPFYFALGQIGYCFSTINYLKNRLENNPDLPETKLILEALGKIGDEASLQWLKSKKINRITPALYNFGIREIGDKSWIVQHITDELKISKNSKDIFESAFSLYRIGPDTSSKELLHNKLLELLNLESLNPGKSDKFVPGVQYLLGCLRKLKWFPDDEDLFYKLLRNNEFIIRIEAVKALCYFNFQNSSQLDRYLSLLSTENQNINRQAAISIAELSVKDELKNYLRDNIKSKMETSSSAHVKGELVLSYAKLFSLPFNTIVEYFNLLTREYIYKICSEYKGSKEAFDYLQKEYENVTGKDRIFLLQALLSFKLDEYIIYHSLSSSSPPLISISADALDSVFIYKNQDTLNSIIISQISKYKDSSDFSESILSLYNLSSRIGEDAKDRVEGILLSSTLYSVKRIAGLAAEKDEDIFDSLWTNAFKYSEAEISTTKGKFTIKLSPYIAPISTGNFIYLAARQFFDGIAFHRVVPGFVIQGGDPTGTGWSGPGYEIISEYSYLEYSLGTVGMASSGKDTEGSQWFVTTAEYPHLNGRYSIFGYISVGMDAVFKIEQDDLIINITLK